MKTNKISRLAAALSGKLLLGCEADTKLTVVSHRSGCRPRRRRIVLPIKCEQRMLQCCNPDFIGQSGVW